jgi:hypothetical protein
VTKRLRATLPGEVTEPANERDKNFCDRWLVHHDHARAYRESGFTVNRQFNRCSLEKLKKFRPYLDRLGIKVEAELAKRISYERHDILQAMAAIGFANAQDYMVEAEFTNPGTGIKEKRYILKRLEDLTRLQASAIDEVFYDADMGRIAYSLPVAKTRMVALATLGENTQALKSKDASVVHNHLHLEGVSNEKLEQLERLFIEAVGPQVSREILGLTEDDQID